MQKNFILFLEKILFTRDLTKNGISGVLKYDLKLDLTSKREEVEIMTEDVIITEKGSKLVAAPVCEIDHHSAKRIRERIDRAIFKCRPELLVLDFSDVRFMDSSGVGLIIGRCEVAEAVGASVRLTGLSERLMKLVRLSGIEKISGLAVSR